MNFRYDKEKTLASVLYIINKLHKMKQEAGFHKIFKILYFAERSHLVKWGRPITGDWFAAMKEGPVPSGIYDILKAIRKPEKDLSLYNNYKEFLSVNNHYRVTGKTNPDMDELSPSEIDCLDASIKDNGPLSHYALTKKSHGSAWKGTEVNKKIGVEKIAREGGANGEMLKYIRINAENSAISL